MKKAMLLHLTGIVVLLIATFFFIQILGCHSPGGSAENTSTGASQEPDKEIVIDIDGIQYHTITIGNQEWMVENLKSKRFRTGDPIPEVTDPSRWRKMKSAAMCSYDNDTINITAYGRLYNGYAVTDPRGICPAGWRVASDADWYVLTNSMGGELQAGRQLMEGGFTALFSGYHTLGAYGFFWTSTEETEQTLMSRFIQSDWQGISRLDNPKNYGFSVRCIKE
jgi:uncharacterized protein (TIGR02145 family)